MTDAQPDEPDDAPSRPGWFYHFGRAVLRPIARLIFRPIVIGKENVPAEGPIILAANHISVIDSLAI
ncbi:MAG: 1-acyl-sn-glycerol-3-phosphate acyltransferase, partial [Microbacterium sp.]